MNSQFLNKVVGVTNPIHRSKITLKAMDVVLFGPPKDSSNPLKDVIISSLLVLALTLLFYAYRQNKQSKQHMQVSSRDNILNTVVHDFNGHGVNGMHGVNGKNCYDGPFYVVNNGKIRVWL